MPTHDIFHFGRVNLTGLDYVNLAGSMVLIALAIYIQSLLLGIVLLGISVLAVASTLYVGRIIARVNEMVDDTDETSI